MTHGSSTTLLSHQTAPVCCYSPTAEHSFKVGEKQISSHGAGL